MKETILRYIMLPSETTETELKHVRKINKVALYVCMAHIPLFLLVAALSGTSLAQAVGFGLLLVAGPWIADRTIENPRHLSLVYGFTSMGLGALLVHLGQSSMQIEMHFHFFAALALLAVWGNPLIIWVATVTVAVHHGAFWFFLPQSVFNYEASFWVVAVHAAFVVVEAIAASFIARNFFDNVIGLEKIITQRTVQLNERNQQMKLILDNTAQGFLTLDKQGVVAQERSAFVEQRFGPIARQATFWDFMRSHDAEFAGLAELGFDDLREGILPLEYYLKSLPSRLEIQGSIYRFDYSPIQTDGELKGLLVVASDISAEIEKARSDARQLETIAIFRSLMQDRQGFMEFIEQTNKIISRIEAHESPSSVSELARDVHTVKGNCSVFGLTSLTSLCHDMEGRAAENSKIFHEIDLKRIAKEWAEFKNKIGVLMGNRDDELDIEASELNEALAMLKAGASTEALAKVLESWRHESMRGRLERIAAQASAMAHKLGKDHVEIKVVDHRVRLSKDQLSEFWSVFSHVYRNAIDHGIESREERAAAQKYEPATLTISTQLEADQLLITVADNGRGIQWDILRRKGQELGLATASQEDLVKLLYVDGISTAEKITQISGRGVGMAAVKAVCDAMGARIELHTVAGKGTTFRFIFPQRLMQRLKAS